MNDEFIMRIGANATALRTELGRTGNYAKAWATTLAEDFKTRLGRMFVAGFLVDKVIGFFRNIKNEILEINRISESTGANSNLVQAMMLRAAQSGDDIESLTKPLQHFNELIGQAKMGVPQAVIALADMGVVTRKNSAETLTYRQALHNLAVEFDRLHDRQKQAALLAQAFGSRGAGVMMPTFTGGAASVDSMSSGNFFTKISQGSISDFQNIWNGIKMTTYTLTATLVNALDAPLKGYREIGNLLGAIAGGARNATQINSVFEKQKLIEENKAFQKSLAAQADKDGISVEQEKTRILDEQAKLLERQRELTGEIADQNKSTVAQMASEARRLTGIPAPRLYGVTPRLRTALNIQTLEDRSKIAWEQGNDAASERLWKQAQSMRADNTWLGAKDQHPAQKMLTELQSIKNELLPVSKMAQHVNDQHGKN